MLKKKMGSVCGAMILVLLKTKQKSTFINETIKRAKTYIILDVYSRDAECPSHY